MGDSGHPERIDPREASGGSLAGHLKRYQFARRYSQDMRVLDAGCGIGYGTSVVREGAASVLGLDRARSAIDRARNEFRSRGVEFAVADIAQMPVASSSFDVLCCFEVVEHLPQPRLAVEEFARVVTADGVILLSTPCVRETNTRPDNPHHQIEFAPSDLADLLADYFVKIELLGQHRKQSALHRWVNWLDVFGVRKMIPQTVQRNTARALGSTAWTDMDTDDFYIDELTPSARQTIAVCRAPRGEERGAT